MKSLALIKQQMNLSRVKNMDISIIKVSTKHSLVKNQNTQLSTISKPAAELDTSIDEHNQSRILNISELDFDRIDRLKQTRPNPTQMIKQIPDSSQLLGSIANQSNLLPLTGYKTTQVKQMLISQNYSPGSTKMLRAENQGPSENPTRQAKTRQ